MKITGRLPPDVFVVIPARNEQDTLGQVIRDAQRFAETIVLVDDHSTDATRHVAHDHGAAIIELTQRTGYGAAISAGLQYSRQRGCSTAITLDADGAHDPADIPGLYRVHQDEQCGLTIGNRFARNAPTLPSTKKWANYLASYLVGQIFNVELDDVACGLRAYSPSFLQTLSDSEPLNGFGFVCDLFAAAVRGKHKICCFPVDVRYDATSILCTTQEEFLQVLAALVTRVAPASQLSEGLSALIAAVTHLEPATIVLERTVLCALPIPDMRGYIFQAQHSYFLSQVNGVRVTL